MWKLSRENIFKKMVSLWLIPFEATSKIFDKKEICQTFWESQIEKVEDMESKIVLYII